MATDRAEIKRTVVTPAQGSDPQGGCRGGFSGPFPVWGALRCRVALLFRETQAGKGRCARRGPRHAAQVRAVRAAQAQLRPGSRPCERAHTRGGPRLDACAPEVVERPRTWLGAPEPG